jgi:IS30 family transposase
LTRCLRTGRALRRPRRLPDQRRERRIPDKVMISERPAEVEDRSVPGHWEGDLIIGKDGGSAIGTLVERSSRFVMLLHLPHGHRAEHVRDAMITTMQALPEALRRSLTWDQGLESSRHAEITFALDLPVYFCDPHSLGNAAATRTPTGCSASTSPKAPICRSTPPPSSIWSPPNSTPDHARHSTGTPPPKCCPGYCHGP